jgi:hypothetical protein
MALAIAQKLEITPRHLPPMNDDQLWQSFKAAVGTGEDVALLPVVFTALRQATHSLSLGEAIAITVGRYFDSPSLPVGGCVSDLLRHVGLGDSDIDSLLNGSLCMVAAQCILSGLEHPATLDWQVRQKRYNCAVPAST